jgi:DNA-binding beta-propeller fold protein YncE
MLLGALGERNTASGAVGDLTFAGCVGTLSGCGAPGNSAVWSHPQTVAVSPDGTQLYVGAGFQSEAISHLTLDASGNPTFSDCVGVHTTGCLFVDDNLDGLGQVVLSPDGTQLYAGSNGELFEGTSFLTASSLDHFPLGAGGGFLQKLGGGGLAEADCVGEGSGCAPWVLINSPHGIAVSPQGGHVYVADGTGNLAHLSASPALGAFDCVGASGACVAPNPTEALYGSDAVALSPDGKQLYVGGAHGVSHLTIGASGTATFENCIGSLSGCTATNPSTVLNSVSSLAVSPDGHNLYVGAGVITHLTLDSSGNMTFHDCIGGYEECSSVPYVAPAVDLALSPGGAQLYAAGGSAIAHFTIGGSGTPTFADCLGPAPGCAATGPSGWSTTGGGVSALAVSHDGKQLYATIRKDPSGAVTHFSIAHGASAAAPGSGGGGPSGGPPAASVKPIVSNVHQANSKWSEGSKLPAVIARARRGAPVGTRFSYALNQPALVTFSFTHRVAGRMVRHECVAKTGKNAKRKACKRTITAGVLTFNGHGGTNTVAFQGRVSRSTKLEPGRYTLVLSATNASGERSAPQSLAFTIVR